MEKLDIAYLADHKEFIETCASWAYGHWGCQSGGSLQHAVTRFTEGANKISPPITFIAIYENRPAGMVSLWEADFNGETELSPWLASLYVHPFHRHKSIASHLIKRLESEAIRLGYSRLFLVTEEARDLYAKFGWVELGKVNTFYDEASLMTKVLGENFDSEK